MKELGWIKLYRSTLDNPIIMQDIHHFGVWCYLLLSATHQPHDTLIGKDRITLLPGQLVTGRKKIAKALGIDEYKAKRILNHFENAQQIAQAPTPYGTLITILNWSEYQQAAQPDAQPLHTPCTSTAQPVHTIQECKKERMEECKNSLSPIPPPSVKPVRNVIPPTVDMVSAYADERAKSGRISVDVDEFYDFYTSNGWKVGKNPMKDWQAAFRTWEKKREQEKKPAQSKPRNEVLDMLQRGAFDE